MGDGRSRIGSTRWATGRAGRLLTAVVLPAVLAAATGTAAAQTSPAPAPATGSRSEAGPSRFVPVDQVRVLDTRAGTGAPRARLEGHGSLRLPLRARAGVPASATSVLLNVTVTTPAQPGFLSVAPAATRGVSSVNFSMGQTVANLVVAPLAADGSLTVTNGSLGSVAVVADVQGYLVPGDADGLVLQAPPVSRVLDTRSGLGSRRGQVPGDGTVRLALGERLPAGTEAVLLNVTVDGAQQGGHVAVSPAQNRQVSSVNFAAQRTVANLVVTRLAEDGTVTLTNGSPGPVSLVADLQGVLVAGADGLLAEPVPAVRVLDTRALTGGAAPLAAGESREVPLGTTAAGAEAVLLNVTVVGPQGPGFVTVAPERTTSVSNVNVQPGRTAANLVLSRVTERGTVVVTNGAHDAVHLVIDVQAPLARTADAPVQVGSPTAAPTPTPVLSPVLEGSPQVTAGPAPTATAEVPAPVQAPEGREPLRAQVRSSGGPVTVALPGVRVEAPAGVIRAGETLTIERLSRASATHGLPSGWSGPLRLSTSQGQPDGELTVTALRPAALATPLFLHAHSASGRWSAEPTETSSDGRSTSTGIDTFSLLDVVDHTVWLTGSLTGNRADPPKDCQDPWEDIASASWISDVGMSRDLNEALPACVSTASTANRLYVNLVNNRGYAMSVQVSGRAYSVQHSVWSSSLVDQLAAALADVDDTRSEGSHFLLGPGQQVRLAFDRDKELVGYREVEIKPDSLQVTAVGALAYALLQEFEEFTDLSAVTSVTDCAAGAVHAAKKGVSLASALATFRTCAETAVEAAERSGKLSKSAVKRAKKAVKAVLVVDAGFKVIDAIGDAHKQDLLRGQTFQELGESPLNPAIAVLPLQGATALPAGTSARLQMTASGGTGPYRFRIWAHSASSGDVPDGLTLSEDGVLRWTPPYEDTTEYRFSVWVQDATGRHSPYERDTVTLRGDGAQRPAPTTNSLEIVSTDLQDVFPSGQAHTACDAAGCTTLTQNGFLIERGASEYEVTSRMPGATSTWWTRLACSRDGLCAALGYTPGGSTLASVRTEGRWSEPVQVAARYDSELSCASTTWCAAVSREGETSVYDGSSWTRTVTPPVNSLSSLDCPTPGTCVALVPRLVDRGPYVDALQGGAFVVLGPGGWSEPQPLPGELVNGVVGCATATWCTVLGRQGDAVAASVWDGASFGAPSLTNLKGAQQDVACHAVGRCVSTGEQGLSSSTEGRWTDWQLGVPRESPASIACAADGSCLGVAATGSSSPNSDSYVGFAYGAGTWKALPAFAPNGRQQHGACAGQSFCMVVDGSFSAVWQDGTWSLPVRSFRLSGEDPYDSFSFDSASAVDCWAVGECMVIGVAPYSIRYSTGGWSDADKIPTSGTHFGSVDCTSASFCMAVTGNNPGGHVWDGQRWTTTSPPVSAQEVACSSPSFCIAVGGAYGDRPYTSASWDGTGWTGLETAWGGRSVSCGKADDCYWLDGSTPYLASAVAGVRQAPAAGGGMRSVHCWSARTCVGTSGSGLSAWDGAFWTRLTQDDDGEVRCSAQGLCLRPSRFNGRVLVLRVRDVLADIG